MPVPHLDAHGVGQLQRICAGKLEHRDGDGGTAIQHTAQRVIVRTQLQARDVAQISGLAVRAALDDDVAEFLLGLQTPLSVDDVLKLRPGEGGLTADLSGGNLHVLLPYGCQYVIDVHAARRNLSRIQPQSHGVVAGAEDTHIAHAGDARQHVLDLNDRVVAQIQRVVAAVAGLQEHDHGQVRRLLLSHQADLPYHVRQSRLSLRHPVLGLYLRNIQIGAELEGHRDGKGAVRRRGGVGVNRVFNTVDLLFQRRDDSLGNGFGRRAGILAADHYRGRNDLGILADRQIRHREQARNRDQNREDSRKDRPFDEERGNIHAELKARPARRPRRAPRRPPCLRAAA